MKIIKPGNPNYKNKPIEFTCETCGCVFEADKNEYDTGVMYNDFCNYCTCPTCGHTVRKDI